MQAKRPAHILWAVLIARIYEVFPLLCPICGGQMRIIASQSRTAPTSGTYWSTSGWRRSHRASPRHAGHRCGRGATRKLQRAWNLLQTGMKRPNRPRTLRSISASVGEQWRQRFNAAGVGCACQRQKPVMQKHLGQLALRNHAGSHPCACLGGPKRGPYFRSCAWISYPTGTRLGVAKGLVEVADDIDAHRDEVADLCIPTR